MGQILKFIRPGSLDPEVTEALISAYEKSGSEHHKRSNTRYRSSGWWPKRIIEVAKQGEADPNRLCEAALATVGFPAMPEIEEAG